MESYMRFSVLALPLILTVAGAGYFFAKPNQDPVEKYLAARATAPAYVDEKTADAEDGAVIARAIANKDLGEDESNRMVAAAGRRYLRRKLAWQEAQSAPAGKVSPDQIAARKRDMDSSRRVFDLAESLGRKTRVILSSARADIEMERLLARGGAGLSALVDRHIGHNQLTDTEIGNIEKAFLKEFGKPLPVSARGASAVHRSLGFDHAGRVDVALSPSGAEGLWLRNHLIGKGISFFAFRSAARGMSTGAHIHIGPASGHAH
jgi:hypothetical protein